MIINNDELGKFARWMKSKGLSKATIESYSACIDYYHSQGYQMTTASLCQWKEEEIRRVSAGTANLRIHALNKYSEYLRLRFRLKPLKIDVPDYIDDEITVPMYQRLLSCLLSDGDYEWYCIIKLLACTGMRISEAMQVQDKHIRQGYIDIIGKGSKLRRVWFPSSLRKDLESKMPAGLIINHNQRYVRNRLHQLAVKYHLPKRPMHPHAFRAFFARRVYEKTKDLQLLQKLLGHASIKTTMRYLRKSSKGMRRRISQIVTW